MLRRPRNPKVAIISDTIDHIDGIAIGLRRFIAASARAGHAITLIGGDGGIPSIGDDCPIVRIPSAMTASLPFYADYRWTVPSIPALVEALRGVELVQLATPGPMGMAGLVAARMLGIPVIAQYHTEVAAYAARMTGLPFLEGIVNPIVGWFYQQADLCLAPSEAVVKKLGELGVAADKIKRVQRGVDLALFDPARRRAPVEGAPLTAIYVGRLSNEKNLDVMLAAWREVVEVIPTARLVVVGDGPEQVEGPNVVTTGVLHGIELATELASADVFLFASETETFGNVVVESAASGVPAIVAAAGASHEHVIPNVTGMICDGTSPSSFAAAVLAVFGAPARRAAMGRAARAHAQSYAMERALATTWRSYRDVIRGREMATAVAS